MVHQTTEWHPTEWYPTDWKSKPIVQDVIYEDQNHLNRVLMKLSHLPPMVSPKEVHFYSKKSKQKP